MSLSGGDDNDMSGGEGGVAGHVEGAVGPLGAAGEV
jgi:hypothetical protein